MYTISSFEKEWFILFLWILDLLPQSTVLEPNQVTHGDKCFENTNRKGRKNGSIKRVASRARWMWLWAGRANGLLEVVQGWECCTVEIRLHRMLQKRPRTLANAWAPPTESSSLEWALSSAVFLFYFCFKQDPRQWWCCSRYDILSSKARGWRGDWRPLCCVSRVYLCFCF